MELNNINSNKHEENTGFKSENSLLPGEDKRRAEAIADIFHDDRDFFDRAGENDTNIDNKTTAPDDYSTRNNFDIKSDFGGPISESLPDVNIYQNKKTVAQGMMDLALFSANANQLRYVLESVNHPYYYSGIVLIAISLIFQVSHSTREKLLLFLFCHVHDIVFTIHLKIFMLHYISESRTILI